MKTIRTDINAFMTDVKIIGNIDLPKNGPLCLVSEKNFKGLLEAFGTISAKELALKITKRIEAHSNANDFNSKMLMEMLNDGLETVQFAVDCGDLLIGDDSKIKEFLNEPAS